MGVVNHEEQTMNDVSNSQAARLTRVAFLKALIKQAKQDEIDGGYEPGELSSEYEDELRELQSQRARKSG